LEGTGFNANQSRILSAVKPVGVNAGDPEQRVTTEQVTTTPYQLRVTGDHDIVATFALEDYELTVTTAGKGSVTKAPDKLTYLFGETVMLEAIPNPGWEFAGWDSGLGTSPILDLTMTGDRVVKATFTRAEYTITIQTVGQGAVQVDPQQETYRYGDKVDLTAVPTADWRFGGWDGDLSGSQLSRRLTIDGDKTIVATFLPPNRDHYLPFVTGK
jgi:hypothetical protein